MHAVRPVDVADGNTLPVDSKKSGITVLLSSCQKYQRRAQFCKVIVKKKGAIFMDHSVGVFGREVNNFSWPSIINTFSCLLPYPRRIHRSLQYLAGSKTFNSLTHSLTRSNACNCMDYGGGDH